MNKWDKRLLWFLGVAFVAKGLMWLSDYDTDSQNQVVLFIGFMGVFYIVLREFEILRKQQDIIIDILMKWESREEIQKKLDKLEEFKK